MVRRQASLSSTGYAERKVEGGTGGRDRRAEIGEGRGRAVLPPAIFFERKMTQT